MDLKPYFCRMYTNKNNNKTSSTLHFDDTAHKIMSLGGTLGLIYGLELQCRALAPVEADTDNVRFLVGTQGLKLPNQIHELQLDEDTRTLSKRIYSHPCGEVWDICSSPHDSSLFCTRYSTIKEEGSLSVAGCVWKTPDRDNYGGGEEGSANNQSELIAACHLDVSDITKDEVSKISWMPVGRVRHSILLGMD